MKKLFFVLLFLIPLLSFAQAPWIYSSGGYAVTTVHSIPDSTILPDLDADLNVMVYLRGYVSGSATGSGWFNPITSAASLDGENVFDHPDTGVRYVRMVTITSILTVGSLGCSDDVFTSTDQVDTVLISGALATDKYIITGIGGSVDQQDVLQAESKVDTLIVHRVASGASALKYIWLRIP